MENLDCSSCFCIIVTGWFFNYEKAIADLEKAARYIVSSKAFDCSTICATEQAVVTFDPTAIDAEALMRAVDEAGYKSVDLAQEAAAGSQARDREQAVLRRLVLLSAALTIPLVAVAMAPMLWPALDGLMISMLPAARH